MIEIEIENECKETIWIMACRTKVDRNKVFIHLAKKRKDLHDGVASKVGPNNYAILNINEVEF